MKNLILITVVLFFSSCMEQGQKNNRQLKDLLSMLQCDLDHNQKKLRERIITNPNKESVESPPGFDSTYTAWVSEINRIDTLIPKIDARLKAYWENKDELEGFDAHVKSVYSSVIVLNMVDFGNKKLLAADYKEHVEIFMKELAERKRSDALYLRVRLTALSIELYTLLEENFIHMNLEKHFLYLQREYGCKD